MALHHVQHFALPQHDPRSPRHRLGRRKDPARRRRQSWACGADGEEGGCRCDAGGCEPQVVGGSREAVFDGGELSEGEGVGYVLWEGGGGRQGGRD